MRQSAALFLMCCLWLAGLAPAALAQVRGRVTDIRIEKQTDGARVTIVSDKPLEYRAFSLLDGAPRVIIDMPLVRWSVGGLTAESGTGKGAGLVSSYRYAHSTATSSRLVLDLSGPARISDTRVVNDRKVGGGGHAIVVDLKSGGTVKAAPATQMASATAPAVRKKKLIVIDPGHGGKDPGALSPAGTREKDVTLAAAEELSEALKKTGRYEVALTRKDDIFIELEDRVSRARNLGADLFISLHADAGGKSLTRGASVYTLSPEGEKRIDAAKKKNDWVLAVEADTSRPVEVNAILADLVQRETKNQSSRFADMLVSSLAEEGWPTLQNTHRRKGLYVLLSPDVPAVLLEMGFMTNASDEALLKTESRRRKLVSGVVEAIDAFFLAGKSARPT
jgi:N-acetylmuramoyl-L-alanine amidase